MENSAAGLPVNSNGDSKFAFYILTCNFSLYGTPRII